MTFGTMTHPTVCVCKMSLWNVTVLYILTYSMYRLFHKLYQTAEFRTESA